MHVASRDEKYRAKARKTERKREVEKMIGVMDGVQVNKRTGAIKSCAYPSFRAHTLDGCYNSYSTQKAHAYNYCMGVMVDLRVQGCEILDYGITSYNTFQFTFAVVFKYNSLTFVRYETARTTKTYILAD